MQLLQSIYLLLLPLWAISALATAIPQPVRDVLSEQKLVAAEQSRLSASSTIDMIAIATSTPESDHHNPSRTGDPYGISDFGIDPAHVTSEQLQSLREAGMIRELDEESVKWFTPHIDSWPLLKLCFVGATFIALIKGIVHFKNR